jgi:putative DNA primase/helicase
VKRFPGQENIDALVAGLEKDRIPKTDGDAPLSAPLPGSEPLDVERAIVMLREEPARREIFDGGMGGYASASEADARMFFNLAYFCRRDLALMEQAALRSGRVRPKWNEQRNGTTWLRQELAKAAERVRDVWKPPGKFLTGDSARKDGGNDGNDSDDGVFQDLMDLPDPEEFPLSALPPTTRRFVREGAASIGCPSDYLGVAVLAALSAAIGDTRRIAL